MPPALDWVTTRAREVAQSRTPLQEQAGNTKLNQVQEEMDAVHELFVMAAEQAYITSKSLNI